MLMEVCWAKWLECVCSRDAAPESIGISSYWKRVDVTRDVSPMTEITLKLITVHQTSWDINVSELNHDVHAEIRWL
jgi:hypothetical protein